MSKKLMALQRIREACAEAGVEWTREVRDAMRRADDLSPNAFICNREKFEIVLESELSYFQATDETP